MGRSPTDRKQRCVRTEGNMWRWGNDQRGGKMSGMAAWWERGTKDQRRKVSSGGR